MNKAWRCDAQEAHLRARDLISSLFLAVTASSTGNANESLQNLLPLFLRPLRIFFTSDQLRVARIGLLKITHFPHVVAISAYESAYQFCLGRSTAGISRASSMGGPESLTSLRRPLRSSLNSPRPRTAVTATNNAAQHRSPPHSGSPTFDRSLARPVAGGAESDGSLAEQVSELRSEIRALAALITQQKEEQRLRTQ